MFSERFDRTIYKYDLFSVNHKIRIDKYKYRSEIYDYDSSEVVEIMVQPTFRKSIYREIVTGMPIPVYRKTYLGVYMGCAYLGHIVLPSQHAFIKVTNLRRYDDPVLEATDEEIREYIEKNTAPNVDYQAQLEGIFQKANEYYEIAYRDYIQKKNDICSQHQEVVAMLRKLRKK